MRSFVLASPLLITLAACSYDDGSLDAVRQTYGVGEPHPQAFRICGSHDCKNVVDVSLTRAEWREIRAAFHPRPRTPGAERRALIEALRRFEIVTGRKTGYDADRARTSFVYTRTAQDCVDEMVNTATYLKLLQDADALRFHQPDQRVSVGFLTRSFWNHTVASVVEVKTGQKFIIDTWAAEFGELPYIMDRDDWADNAELRREF